MFVWRQFHLIALVAVLFSTASSPLLAQAMEEIVHPVPTNFCARSISADGSTVIGNARFDVDVDCNEEALQQAYRWSQDGWHLLGTLTADGSGYSDATGVSADGAVIVGSTDIEEVGYNHRRAYRWTSDGMVALGTLRTDGSGYSYATGVSADGVKRHPPLRAKATPSVTRFGATERPRGAR